MHVCFFLAQAELAACNYELWEVRGSVLGHKCTVHCYFLLLQEVVWGMNSRASILIS